jgi:hypothetical protein
LLFEVQQIIMVDTVLGSHVVQLHQSQTGAAR